MIVRTAHFLGTVPSDKQAAFNRVAEEEVLPLLGQFPGIIKASVERPTYAEEGAPAVYQIYRLQFPDVAAMETALASPIRAQIHAAMAPLLQWFEGEIVHYVSDLYE